MISRLGLRIASVFRRTVPDPFVIAVLLTVVTAVLALGFGNFAPRAGVAPTATTFGGKCLALLDAWRAEEGLWYFLAFSMQMCLILVTGHAIAVTRPVRRAIDALAGLPRSTAGAAAMVGAIACGAAVVNWGLGLIVGALLAREAGRSLARRGIRAHYPLIVAAGYTGLMVWHGGLSGSAPLSMTTLAGAKKVLREEYIATLGPDLVPLSSTLFSTSNLIITGGLLVLTPLVLWMLSPRHTENIRPFEGDLVAPATATPEPDPAASVPDRLERSRAVMALLAVPLVLGLWRFAQVKGLGLAGLNEVNAAMLAAGLILHGSVRSYAAAAEDGARGCAGIMLQFPLYGGIMSMMVASGLVRSLAEGMSSVASAQTLPFLTFCSAAILNLFIPSGGGQWGVQGPIALESAFALGVDPGRVVMSVAYGDQLTNMLQPFWALPLLAITGAKARDIVGYTAIVMVAAALWIGAGLLLG